MRDCELSSVCGEDHAIMPRAFVVGQLIDSLADCLFIQF
jgi:hypothetical protein